MLKRHDVKGTVEQVHKSSWGYVRISIEKCREDQQWSKTRVGEIVDAIS